MRITIRASAWMMLPENHSVIINFALDIPPYFPLKAYNSYGDMSAFEGIAYTLKCYAMAAHDYLLTSFQSIPPACMAGQICFDKLFSTRI